MNRHDADVMGNSVSLNRTPALPRKISHQAGLTLVELMIALVLGLLIIAGALSILFANKQSYNANNALGQVQDNTRVAFEMMARDIRQTGLTGCGNQGYVSNVLNNGPYGSQAHKWYADINNAIVGYDGGEDDPASPTGTSVGARVSGTSSIELVGSDGVGVTVASHTPDSASTSGITINETSTTIQAGDIIVVCDPNYAAITQVTTVAAGPPIKLGNNSVFGTPGNCSVGLGFQTSCTDPGNTYVFAPNSQIGKLYAADWYIGNNPSGGRSLYRTALVNEGGGVVDATSLEMVRGVTDMQIKYYSNPVNASDFVSAASITDWSKVTGVMVTLTLASTDNHASATGTSIGRTITTTIALRNRL